MQGKEQSQTLYDSAILFAQQMLEQHGEFLPYAEALKSNGEISALGADMDKEFPKSSEVIDLLRNHLKEEAVKGTYVATAIIYDVRVRLPSSEEISDAIAIQLNHVSGYSVIVYKPYKLTDSSIVYGALFVHAGRNDVFD